MMEKGTQKAQIIGNIDMNKVNMLMETLKVNPMQIGTQPFPKFTK
jgi:hypothetical protein